MNTTAKLCLLVLVMSCLAGELLGQGARNVGDSDVMATLTYPIKGALPSDQGYEIDIKRRVGQEFIDFRRLMAPAGTTTFAVEVPYGAYRVSHRVRRANGVLDQQWSLPTLVKTDFPEVKRLQPEPNFVYPDPGGERQEVVFAWRPHRHVRRYVLEWQLIGSRATRRVETTKTSYKVDLVKGLLYRWRVVPATKIKSPGPISWWRFSIAPSEMKRLSKPQYTDASMIRASWEAVPGAQFYRYRLTKLRPGKPRVIWEGKTEGLEVYFKKKVQLGVSYLFSLVAYAETMQPSEESSYRFNPSREEDLNEQDPEKVEFGELDDSAPKLPPTRVWTKLEGVIALENLESKGVIGDFSGNGSHFGSALRLEIAPRPGSNMMYFEGRVHVARFTSKADQSVSNTGQTGVVTTTIDRVGGHFFVSGRSGLSRDFWGFGLGVFSQSLPKLVSANESTGVAQIDSRHIYGPIAVFLWRQRFAGYNIVKTVSLSPLSANTKSFIRFENFLTFHYALTRQLSLGLGYQLRYLDTTIQKTCSTNQPDLCTEPKTTQLVYGLLGNVSYRF